MVQVLEWLNNNPGGKNMDKAKDRIEQGIADGKWSRESIREFEKAVKNERLSLEMTADNYVGRYMYMGSNNGKAAFKNILTRAYDV
jgi:hypothetical protein